MRIALALFTGFVAAACGGPVTCAPGEVPNEVLQGCVIPKQCDGGTVNERNECEWAADAGETEASRESGLSAEGMGGRGSTKSEPAIEPAVAWMCMKNSAGGCSSCQQDSDCTSEVCELGYCMDCRDSTQCVDATCISNRCVPDRKPSSVWTTSGGGLSTSSGFKLLLSIGTPSPAATASSAGYQLSVAPGAGNF